MAEFRARAAHDRGNVLGQLQWEEIDEGQW
jgi:hypothetical protein